MIRNQSLIKFRQPHTRPNFENDSKYKKIIYMNKTFIWNQNFNPQTTFNVFESVVLRKATNICIPWEHWNFMATRHRYNCLRQFKRNVNNFIYFFAALLFKRSKQNYVIFSVVSENSFFSNISLFTGRKKKKKLNKYLAPLIVGFLLIKSILLPLVLKALAIMSGKAVVLSTMSLILAAILGLRGIAGGAAIKKSDTGHYNYRRRDYFNNHNYRDKFEDDEFYQDYNNYQERFRDPYRYYSGNAKKRWNIGQEYLIFYSNWHFDYTVLDRF